MTDDLPDDLPEDFLPDEIMIAPLESDIDEGGVIYGLGKPRDAPVVIELGNEQRRYRVKEPNGSGYFSTLDTWECSCGLAESVGYCFHLRAAATYDRLCGGDEDT